MHKRFMLLVVLSCPIVAADKPKEDANVKELRAYLSTLPEAQVPVVNQEQALALVSMPLACVDHPHTLPEQRVDYLWVHDAKAHILDAYDKNRAFYGCSDWHSAVHSVWALVDVVKQYPQIPVGPLIREKLKDHLGKKNIEGEMEFLKNAKRFEIPYGYAWTLKLYAELKTWEDPQAKTWAENVAPLAQQVSKKLVEYFDDLTFPVRSGVHQNTAFDINVVLDYTDVAGDTALRDSVSKTAHRFFVNDRDCPTGYEPTGTDFLSPCLTEARLMARIMDQQHFVLWLNDFLPPVYSAAFKPLTVPPDVSGIKKDDLQGGKSHLIGLGFARAEAMLRIANALPANDPRIRVLRRLAAINARSGFQGIADAGYMGSHWFGTYALLYLHALASEPSPAVAKAPEKAPATGQGQLH